MENKKVNKVIIVFSLFVLGSFLGFVHENLLTLLKGHFVLRQGLIYGPFIPIYGIGLAVFYLIYSKIEIKKEKMVKEFFLVFLLGFLIGGFTEYIASYVQEVVFGTKSWDYTNLKFDINGRTSLFHATFWGIMSLVFYVCILPFVKKLINLLNNKTLKIFILIISVFIIFDCIISAAACFRQNQRRNNVEAKNIIAKNLDKYYPDEYLDKIYNNAKVVK